MGSHRPRPPASLQPPNRWPTAAHGSRSSTPGLVRGQSIEGGGRRWRCRQALDSTPRAGRGPAPRHPAPTPHTRPQANPSYPGQVPRATGGRLGPAAGSARSATRFLRPLRSPADTWLRAHCPSPHTAAHMRLGQHKCNNWGWSARTGLNSLSGTPGEANWISLFCPGCPGQTWPAPPAPAKMRPKIPDTRTG